ncbi:hypothetical protein OPW07_24080 [Vibrio europaeus]|uniref:hypothetical protein n=1 Tax=Vibrio europaeus TaxID=300876 RepID=UPI0018A79044|nr:hypothetical protein [Vibrio europaeus]MDC5812803.1 hypothetical protein [Vibrio europaeus]QPG37597.1 hypothetical protein IXK98_14915 [Vibrio europaeus]
MKKILVVLSVIVTAVLFYLNRPDQTPLDFDDLELLTCRHDETVLSTKVHYFVDSSLKEFFGKRSAVKQIEFANQTLENSCLPLERQLASYQYVDFSFSDTEYLEEVYLQGRSIIGKDRLDSIENDPLSYFVFVLDYRHPIFEENIDGMTHWEFNHSFILLADEAPLYVLEHEFGHLMYANHSETLFVSLLQGQLERSLKPANKHLVKPYARADKCANAGTIMSYEKLRLPIYSDPAISYRDESCGNELHADNNRRVREFIASLREAIENGETT